MTSHPVTFHLQATGPRTGARAGLLHTPHGTIPTPVFMPVGTQATVKALDPTELKALGAAIILSNTYHLALRPGPDLIAQLGGLHGFMGWPGPILTDSGGFQVFSLAHRQSIDDDGVEFASHLDGTPHRFAPERVVAIQEALGADIAMVLDEPSPYPSEAARLRVALERTHRWAERCRAAHTRPDQGLFAIVQGGTMSALRQASARFLAGLDFPGYAVGGLSLGEPKALTYAMLEETTPLLPADKPRYLMGVGAPDDLLEGVARGIDMFDCVLPTRVARNGGLYTRRGRINIRNARYRDDFGPAADGCDCLLCRDFSLAYLRHLFLAQEPLAYRLATGHNVRFLVRLMAGAREAILSGRYPDYLDEFLEGYRAPVREVGQGARRRGAPVRIQQPRE
ncbi:MAG: tRNA guanosine(34) transglycosylase Tgt [Chloroflexi bacterium]|nr:tRNA guanosine(34) transglycosylase Tgt [Chloroflexota bacterium]